MDIEARFKAAEEKIKDAESVGHIFGIIGQVLLDLNDSHTFFIPPWRANRTEYGWQMQAVGDRVYIVAVKPGSDAEKKGVKAGDQLLSLHGFQTSREALWKLTYMFYTLRPQAGLRMVLQSPEGQQRQLDVMASVKQGKAMLDLQLSADQVDLNRERDEEDRLERQRYVEVGDKVFIWKMPTFSTSEQAVEDVMRKSRKHETLILDLRGNPGGYVSTLRWFTGYFFDREIKMDDLKARKEMKPEITTT